MCGVDREGSPIRAAYILYQLLLLHKKLFSHSNNRLWQPIGFPSQLHKLNCEGIAHYFNGDLRSAKRAWKEALKLSPLYPYSLYNLAVSSPLRIDSYLAYSPSISFSAGS